MIRWKGVSQGQVLNVTTRPTPHPGRALHARRGAVSRLTSTCPLDLTMQPRHNIQPPSTLSASSRRSLSRRAAEPRWRRRIVVDVH